MKSACSSFTTATHKHRSLGAGALQGYHGWRGTMEHSCNSKHIFSVTANELFIITINYYIAQCMLLTAWCHEYLQWLNSPSLIPSKLSPDHPAPHVVQPCFSIRDVRDWLITPQTFARCTGTRPHPWEKVGGIYILPPDASFSSYHQGGLSCRPYRRRCHHACKVGEII